jgi:predicted site-specific integrase-resolvase
MPDHTHPTPALLAWPRKAEQLDVSTRTLDTWVAQGKLAPPVRVNNRKYSPADERPKADAR